VQELFARRKLELPAPTTSAASASLIISLFAGPIVMCLLIASPGIRHAGV